MKPYLPTAGLALLILYLGIQALTGQRGLLSGAERSDLLVRRERQLAELSREHAELSSRVRFLKSHHLSRDLLEERARVVLGFSDPRDYVIRVSTPERIATASAAA